MNTRTIDELINSWNDRLLAIKDALFIMGNTARDYSSLE